MFVSRRGSVREKSWGGVRRHRFTYAQFGERAERLAAGLAAEGVQPGDRVAYLSFNNNALLEGYYGVVLAHAVVMPLNVRLTPPELVAILNHSEAKMLIFENDFAPLVAHIRAACPAITRYVTIDAAGPQADLTYVELLAHGRMQRPDIRSFDENAIAELFYTSGSTGTPKGVTLSHRTLYLHALAVAGTSITTIRRWSCTPSRCSTPTVGGVRKPPP